MEWIEANPLPPVCQSCQEEECYNCDYAGERWYLSEEQMIRCKMQEKAAERQRRRNASEEKL